MFNDFFPPQKNRTVYEINRKTIIDQHKLNIKIGRMRIA